ncbi:MAG: hypothetical protein QOE25_173 [Actinomycetota bacterium]|jgi:excisionase family DNA binding protein|nr:hypothetical protein [Actinomycetota bacterium]
MVLGLRDRDVPGGDDVARVTAEPPEDEGHMARDPQSFASGSLLTVSEVAQAMRVSNMTVYRLIKSGAIPAVRIGKNYRIREAEVERYLAARSVRVVEG